MAKQIANVDILTDTFNTWILRTNEVVDALNTDVITANSTAGITGSIASPRNAKLFGTFTANTLVSNTVTLGTSFTVNSTSLVIGSTLKLVANNSSGTLGQVLTSDGSTVYWAAAPGTGTVTQIANSAGILFTNVPFGTGPNITTSGTIGLKAGDGIVVDSRGISVNTAFIASGATNAATLQNRTWEAPAAIGTTAANTGTFTTVTAGLATGYRLQGDTVFLINNATIRTQGNVDATTPAGPGTVGGVRVRGNSSGAAYIQITNNLGTEWSNFLFNSAGKATYSGAFEVQNFTFNGTGLHGGGAFPNVEIGYKTIPQIVTNSNITINTTNSSGAHHYKTGTSDISLTLPTGTIGTAITFVNDAASGNITILAGTGVTLQLGGTLTTGNRTIGPGGVATALAVTASKWIVSGTGVT
jgi:hypothetical protein